MIRIKIQPPYAPTRISIGEVTLPWVEIELDDAKEFQTLIPHLPKLIRPLCKED